MKKKIVEKFSQFSKKEKINWLLNVYLDNNVKYKEILLNYWHQNYRIQKLHDEFSENTISNFYLPFSIAPNFLINNQIYAIPMVTEESSVVAAACKAAKFWINKGGFKTKIISNIKLGHTHFIFDPHNKTFQQLNMFFKLVLKNALFKDTELITKQMSKRGGGLLSIKLINKTKKIPGYYQLEASFNTKDAMGANFINSCMEQCGITLKREIYKYQQFNKNQKKSLQIIINILSNYNPNCLVHAEVSCNINKLIDEKNIIHPKKFIQKFYQAIQIAELETCRATTHNKGIMNGIDAVVIATGNDFRAVEACVHTFAARKGKYSSLTHCQIDNNIFKFWIDLPISIGVIGGVTNLHPLVKTSLAILGHPNASQLMSICAVIGLAQNFSAIYSLITTGIQQGHMKMHLLNILNKLHASNKEKEYLINFFKNKIISYHQVIQEFNRIKQINTNNE